MSPHCPECDEHVSADYVRVLGLDGEIVSCWRCETRDARHAPGQHEGVSPGYRP